MGHAVIRSRGGAVQPGRLLGLALAALLLAGCESIFEPYKPPPLPGDRRSVLALQQRLEPDPGIQDVQVRLPRPFANPDWTQDGGNADKAMHHLVLAEAPREIWRATVGSGSSKYTRLTAQPAIAGGRVFALDAEGEVSAHSLTDGRRLWRTSIVPRGEDAGVIGGGVAYAYNMVFVSSGYGEVIALDVERGSEIWSRRVGPPISSPPTVSAGRIFVVTEDNQLVALAAADGVVLWNHVGIAESAGLVGAGSPAVSEGVVVAAYSSGELVALRADSGRVIWTESLSRTGQAAAIGELSDINGRPVIDRGVVYAVGHGGRMVANDLVTGARVWTQNIAGVESPWVAGDYIFLITLEGELTALSRADGRIRWVTELPVYERPADRRGRILWSGPILASDRLIITSSNGQAVAVSPYNGRMLGSVRLADNTFIAPILAAETLLVLTDDGRLAAYR
ncbi:MAG: pyrrolo-quinoline quinone [Alphaproteobacteria bacterium]|nr:pyrrolo-quinoline quinone [Alphaproteobacteria bacterium]